MHANDTNNTNKDYEGSIRWYWHSRQETANCNCIVIASDRGQSNALTR